MTTERLEAFSDGVFAIAITLLVLEIAVPHPGADQLAHALAAQWPTYLAYAVSFFIIRIIWINHQVEHQQRAVGPVEHAEHRVVLSAVGGPAFGGSARLGSLRRSR